MATKPRQPTARRKGGPSASIPEALPVVKSQTWTYSFAENAMALKRDETDLEVIFTRLDQDLVSQAFEIVEDPELGPGVRLGAGTIQGKLIEVARLRLKTDSARAISVMLIKHLVNNFAVPLEDILGELAAATSESELKA